MFQTALKISFLACVVILFASLSQADITVCDDFNTCWDYKHQGTEGTIWNGIVGLEHVILMKTCPPPAECNTGKLYIRSSNGYWSGNDKGVLLYRQERGDFMATVEITNYPGLYPPIPPLNNSSFGLMARVGDVNAAGPGEDWIIFQWNPPNGLTVRSCDDGNEPMGIPPPPQVAAGRFIRLVHLGDMFYCYSSPDGITWSLHPSSPVTRTEMEGLPLQIGLEHSVAGLSSEYVEFDNFCLEYHLTGDLNNDCKVDFEDLQIMCSEWLTNDGLADIYADGNVDFKDFALLAKNWLAQCD